MKTSPVSRILVALLLIVTWNPVPDAVLLYGGKQSEEYGRLPRRQTSSSAATDIGEFSMGLQDSKPSGELRE